MCLQEPRISHVIVRIAYLLGRFRLPLLKLVSHFGLLSDVLALVVMLVGFALF